MLWKRKTKEQKIIEEMKQKKAQIDKLKEEMNNMAKLVLKDGKLQKVEETPKVVEQPKEDILPPPSPPQQMKRPQQSPPPTDEEFEQNLADARRSMEQMYHQQQQQRQMAQDNYNRQQDDMARYQQQQRILPPIPPSPPPQLFTQPQYQQPYQPPYPQYQQPVYQQPLPPPPPEVNIQLNIEMSNGTLIKLGIPASKYDGFIGELENAINGQTTLTLNNRVINGRNVVSYYVEE